MQHQKKNRTVAALSISLSGNRSKTCFGSKAKRPFKPATAQPSATGPYQLSAPASPGQATAQQCCRLHGSRNRVCWSKSEPLGDSSTSRATGCGCASHSGHNYIGHNYIGAVYSVDYRERVYLPLFSKVGQPTVVWSLLRP